MDNWREEFLEEQEKKREKPAKFSELPLSKRVTRGGSTASESPTAIIICGVVLLVFVLFFISLA